MDVPAEWTQFGRNGMAALRHDETAERDEEFAGLVDRQSRFMFRVAYSLLRNVQDAEDAVQEAFLKLYRGEAWQRMEDERAFLARTVWRVALDRAPRAAERTEDVEGMEIAAVGESPEDWAAAGDERAMLRQMIAGLPEELRQALLLSSLEEMTSGEVAAVMGIPEGTVRTRVMRAKGELRKRYEALREVRR
jgi:RNA polymerase sigma-70 factor (ECF subfamily)